MDSATLSPVHLPKPAAPPARREVATLLEQVLACSAEEKRYLLEQILRNCLGPTPPKEMAIYNADGSEYVFILDPDHRIGLFVTPERLAQWEKDKLEPGIPFSEIVAMLERGDEAEIRQFIARTS